MSSTSKGASRSRLISPAFWFRLMLVSSLAISVVSAYETFIGLQEFMVRNLTGALMAGVLTFGIQALLFALSWNIAENLRGGVSALLPRIIGWMMCAFASGFFSFYGFFNGQGGRDEAQRVSVIQAETLAVLDRIDAQLSKALDEAHKTATQANSPFSNWIDGSLRQLLSVSSNAQQAIEAAATKKSGEIRDEIQQERARRIPLEEELRELRVSLSSGDRQLERLRGREDALTNQLAAAESDALAARARLLQLQAELEQELITGVEPNVRRLRLEINSAEAELAGSQTLLELREEELQQSQELLAQEEDRQTGGTDQERITEIETELGKIDGAIVALQANLEREQAGTSFDFDTEQASFEGVLDQFQDKNYEAHGELIDICTTLRAQLINTPLNQQVEPINCGDNQVSAVVSGLRQLKADRDTYRAECRATAPEIVTVQNEDGTARATANPLIEHTQDCVGFVTESELRTQLQSDIQRLMSRRGEKANNITVAAVALFEDQQGTAVMAAILAIIVDLLVLICAVIGRSAGKSEYVQGIDLLIGLMRTTDEEGFSNVVLLPKGPNQRAMLDEPLGMLIREDLAVVDPSNEERRLMKEGAKERLREERAREIADETAGRPQPNRRGGGPGPRRPDLQTVSSFRRRL